MDFDWIYQFRWSSCLRVNEGDFDRPWDKALRHPYITYLLCGLCVVMFYFQQKASDSSGIGYPGCVDGYSLFRGDYWGLLTSFFYHGSITHIGFNLYWLYLFGRAVEPYIGWHRYLIFWLVATMVSSMGEVILSGETGVGASGFAYALFGFIWVGGRTHPYLASVLNPQTVMLFCLWLFACVFLTWTGAEAIANGAHFAGFIFGCLYAYAFLERTEPGWKWTVGAVAVLAFLPLFYAPWLSSWNMTEVVKAYNAGKYDQTLVYLDRTKMPEYENYLLEVRGNVLSNLNRDDEAAVAYKNLLTDYSETELMDPAYVYNEYAWILATSPNDKIRNPADAIHYAELACKKSDYKDLNSLDTLAAAYASAGQFDQAVTWEQKAIEAGPDPKTLDELNGHMKLFKAEKPYLEPAGSRSAGAR